LAGPSTRRDAKALRNVINQADLLLALVPDHRRFTRLTNAFGKSGRALSAVTLWYTYYNFCRIHKSVRVTPVMEAGITDHQWWIEELLG